MNVQILKVSSFTSEKNAGNPAGVVLKPEGLKEHQMKKISEELHVSETAYVFPSEQADYHLRFFSPAVEVDLCGHATIAAFTVIGRQMQPEHTMITKTQKTTAGILPVRLHYTENGILDIVLMRQRKPVFEPVSYDYKILADILNISVDSICKDLPQERVSTGLFTLPVELSSFSVLKQLTPDFKKIKRFCQKLHVGSIHLFTFDTLESESLYHARNFAPLYEINEDPVTGTANGAVCSYLFHHHRINVQKMKCEQGDIIGQAGRVHVTFSDDEVWVGGKAIILESIELTV